MDNLIEQLRLTPEEMKLAQGGLVYPYASRLPQEWIKIGANAQLLKLLKDERIEIKCTECGGEGVIPIDTPFSSSLPSADCPTCKGTGYQSKEELIKELEG